MLFHAITNGHQALFLENGRLRVGVLPGKGADIFELAFQPADQADPIQLLMKTPRGLQPPSDHSPADFLENYEGGWQELFPNVNDACLYQGVDIPFHGEVAFLPWQYEVIRDDDAETAVSLWVDCQLTPFRVERRMRLLRGETRLIIEEKVTNFGPDPRGFVWGHHLTLGGDFLEEGCLLDVPACRIYTPDVLFDPETARLAPAQNEAWPYARGLHGTLIDLRYIPGPQAHSHDDVFLGSLERGIYSVTNPRLKLRFSLEWDVNVFPWLTYWQPFGGADLPPLTGIYGVGLEPWTARYPLAQAVKVGRAHTLAGGQSLETILIAKVQPVNQSTGAV
jgi:hypothetical protein